MIGMDLQTDLVKFHTFTVSYKIRVSPGTKSVLNDELDADNSTCGHHFGAVLDQVDHRRQKKLKESVNLQTR